MTRQQAEQFISIYNALLTISTKGDDTRTMSKVLDAMENLANTIKVKEDEEAVVAPTESTVKGE